MADFIADITKDRRIQLLCGVNITTGFVFMISDIVGSNAAKSLKK
jgi:hypothetical protein